nr:MAG TPA: hypothetical protein [Caudoviricetes sp.]
MAVPTGATHFLVTEVTDNEGHDDSGQHIGRDVKQELSHRLPPLPGGRPTRLIAIFTLKHKATRRPSCALT